MKIHLQRIEPEQDCFRFYKVAVMPTLFGEWSVVREWGRIGQGGTERDAVFGSERDALVVAGDLVRVKRRRGYCAAEWPLYADT